jgi:hypothetical protein
MLRGLHLQGQRASAGALDRARRAIAQLAETEGPRAGAASPGSSLSLPGSGDWRRPLVLTMGVLLAACGEIASHGIGSEGADPSQEQREAPSSARSSDVRGPDAGMTEPVRGEPRDAGEALVDAGYAGGPAGPSLPGATVLVEQIGLSGAAMGESALLVGPDGTSVLIDIGGQALAKDVLAAIERRLGRRAVDWLIITHYHGDHIGAFEELFVPSPTNQNSPVQILRGLIWRGPFDVEASLVKDGAFEALCQWTRAAPPGVRVIELCEGERRPECGAGGAGEPWAARTCQGLRLGNVERDDDDFAQGLSFIELGDTARLTFFAVNGFAAAGEGIVNLAADGLQLGTGAVGFENSRSLAALVRWGAFDFVFAGDLTGGGKEDAPDVESLIARRGPSMLEQRGGRRLFPTGALDLLHLSHHGTRSSTNQAWVDWLLPTDGRVRNALSGASNGYWGAPAQTVLDRVLPRLSGGAVWMTDASFGAGGGQRLRVLKSSVVVEARQQGRNYRVGPLKTSADAAWETAVSTEP